MDERKRKDLSKYRFERAEEELDTAKQLLTMGKINKSVNSKPYLESTWTEMEDES